MDSKKEMERKKKEKKKIEQETCAKPCKFPRTSLAAALGFRFEAGADFETTAMRMVSGHQGAS